MTVQLSTLAAVKAKLGIPTADTSIDTQLQSVLDAAEAFISRETGFEANATAHTEYYRDLRSDAAIKTKFRPVDSSKSYTAQNRSYGGTTWTDLTLDLIDPTEGDLVLVPELNALLPYEYRRTNVEYDVVKITYTTTAFDATTRADLSDAVAALAAYWWTEHSANAKDQSAGPISTSFQNLPIPPAIEAQLASHRRGIALWA